MEKTKKEDNVARFSAVFDKSPLAVMAIRVREENGSFDKSKLEYMNKSLRENFVFDTDSFYGRLGDFYARREKISFVERVYEAGGEVLYHSYYDEAGNKYVKVTAYLDGAFVVCMLEDITFRVIESKNNAQLRLREKQEDTKRFGSLVDEIDVGVVICEYANGKERVLLQNRRLREMLGASIEKKGRVARATLRSMLQGEDLEESLASITRLKNGAERQVWEAHCTNQVTKEKIWLLINANTVQSDNGEILIIVCCTDISHRKLIEKELIESRQNLDVAVRHAGFHYWNYDLTTDCIYMNEQTGAELEMDSVQKNFPDSWISQELIHPEDVPVFLEGIKKVKRGVKYVNFQARLRAAGTDRFEWKNVKFTTFSEKGGKPTYAVATAEDAVAYKKLEEAMGQIMHQNGLWSWELDMREHKMSQIHDFGEISPLGIRGVEMSNVPESLFEKYIIYEEDWNACKAMFERLYSGQEHTKVQCRTWSQKMKDYVWYEYNFSIIEKENGIPVRAIGTSRNISHEKRIERLYHEEQKILMETDDTMISFSRLNLSKNRVEGMIVRGENIPIEKVMYLLDFRERISCYFEDVEISDRDNEKLSVAKLYEMHKLGISETETHFIAKRKGEEKYICVRVSCHILERPESGDIIAFFYDRDDTVNYVSGMMMETIVKRDYEMTAVVFTNARQFQNIMMRSDTDRDAVETMDYDIWRQCYCQALDAETGKRLTEEIAFENVCEKLLKYKTYMVEFGMQTQGIASDKQLRFTYIGSDQKIILITQIDISDIVRKEKETQRQLEEALNLAEKANNAKSEFLSTVSHEIRTPMNVIIGMTQLAQEEKDNNEALVEYIDEINFSSKHLLNLVNNVLDMSKIESGEFLLHPQKYEFSELRKSVDTMIFPLCSQKQITLEIEDRTVHKAVEADKMRLNQVLFNLLSNAVKYTNVGGHVRFVYQTSPCEGKVLTEFTVQDNGIGMSKEFQEQMFKPFSQENNVVVASTQGTGLGLSIAKGIIDKMQGELTVDSTLGEGTTFQIRLLLPESKEECISPVDTEQAETVDFTGHTILIAEDHDLNQVILVKLLEKKGAKTVTVSNGKEAVDCFAASEENSIDLILMDVRMPVMDGLQAAREVRALDRADAKSVPILAMTANAYDEDRQKSSAAGMNGHLTKPIDTKVLYETIQSFF